MSSPQSMALSAISRHVDGLEVLIDADTIAGSPTPALSNLLARLRRLEQVITYAARK